MQGEVKQGRDVLYGAQRSAYAVEPWETVNYADCHDGQTLFDQVLIQMLFCSCSTISITCWAHKCMTVSQSSGV